MARLQPRLDGSPRLVGVVALECYDLLVGHPHPDDLYTAIRTLPITERLRLVERVVHDVAVGAEDSQGAASLLGLMEDEPELVDQVCALAFEAREKARLRPADG